MPQDNGALTPREARAVMLEERRIAQRARVARFTPMPAKPSLSKRVERRPSWFTKKHTPARRKDIAEARKLREQAA